MLTELERDIMIAKDLSLSKETLVSLVGENALNLAMAHSTVLPGPTIGRSDDLQGENIRSAVKPIRCQLESMKACITKGSLCALQMNFAGKRCGKPIIAMLNSCKKPRKRIHLTTKERLPLNYQQVKHMVCLNNNSAVTEACRNKNIRYFTNQLLCPGKYWLDGPGA